jgi:uncharacterized membrane protein
MDANNLHELRAPIKERYRQDSAAALSLEAAGTLDDQRIASKLETSRQSATAGLHPVTGVGS